MTDVLKKNFIKPKWLTFWQSYYFQDSSPVLARANQGMLWVIWNGLKVSLHCLNEWLRALEEAENIQYNEI